MPRFDGTGPYGSGPRTGWGRGPCGLGMRRGMGFRRVWTNQDERSALEEEKEALKQELKAIEEDLKNTRNQK